MTFDHVAQNATVLNTAFPQMAVGGGEFIVDPPLGPNHPGMGGQNCVVEKEPYEALMDSKNDLLDARTKFEAVGDRQTVDWINRAVEYIDFQATYPVYACCCCCAEYDTHMGRLATDYAYQAAMANSKFLPEDINRIGCAHKNLAQFDVYDSQAQPDIQQGDPGSQPDVQAPPPPPPPPHNYVFGTKAPSSTKPLAFPEPPPKLQAPAHVSAAALTNAAAQPTHPVQNSAPPPPNPTAAAATASTANSTASSCVPAALAAIPPPRVPVLNNKKGDGDDDQDEEDDREETGPVQADSGGTPEESGHDENKIDAAELRRKLEVLSTRYAARRRKHALRSCPLQAALEGIGIQMKSRPGPCCFAKMAMRLGLIKTPHPGRKCGRQSQEELAKIRELVVAGDVQLAKQVLYKGFLLWDRCPPSLESDE